MVDVRTLYSFGSEYRYQVQRSCLVCCWWSQYGYWLSLILVTGMIDLTLGIYGKFSKHIVRAIQKSGLTYHPYQ
ncbi:uncharacterized protein BDV17DRAFT_191371 [Aspergillus undulatus]|uniref:uncharacterized protein n=1 Tax=Aspergillus undulatus TaxID=1810928 RepID=UPI003CCCC3A2